MLKLLLSLFVSQAHPQAVLDDCMGSCTIEPGVYELTEPLRVVHPRSHVTAYGATFTAYGLIVTSSASFSTWSGGVFVGTFNDPDAVGIEVRRPAKFVDTHVVSFGRGLVIDCGDDSDAHCNHWKLYDLFVAGNLLDGILVRGADSNAGLMSGVSSVTNCAAASSHFEPPNPSDPCGTETCANFNLRPFLNVTLVAPHSSQSMDRTTKERFAQYALCGSNNRTAMLGAYAEQGDFGTGNGPSFAQGYGHHVYGGLLGNMQISGGALRIAEWATASRLNVPGAAREGYPQLSLCLGECDGTGSPFVLRAPGPDGSIGEFRLMYASTELLELEYGRRSRHWLLRWFVGGHWGDPTWFVQEANPWPMEER